MDLLINIALNLLLILGFYIVSWCRNHKQATLAIFVVIMMVIDVVFILWRFGAIQL